VPVAAPESTKAPEQAVVASVAAMESTVEKLQREPVLVKQEAPVKPVVASGDMEQKESSPKKQEVPAPVNTEATAHPASLGRIGNDPRDNPSKQIQSTVLQPGVGKSAAPSPSTSSRAVAESLPSLVGRISNDPRSARQPSDKD